jgi:hypothetical protein
MLKKLLILGLGFAGGLFLGVLLIAAPKAASAHDVQPAHHGSSQSTQVSYTQRTQRYTHVSVSSTAHYSTSKSGNLAQKITVIAHATVNYTAWTKSYFHYTQRITVHKAYSNDHHTVSYIQSTQVSYTAWTKSYIHVSARAYVRYTYWTAGKPKKVSVTIKAKVNYTSRTKTYAHYTADTQIPVSQTA